MIFLLFIPFILFAYQISDNIIYPKEYSNVAKFIKENNISRFYSKSFGYNLDSPLYIGVMNNKKEIPNAFSTQVPFNETIFFNGGSGMGEYFSSNSWLITLLTHEIAHDYQLNAKQSISKKLHKVLGNNPFPIFVSIIPIFTLPNLTLPTFLLEGDSVLNESKFHNGGRLYNGELNALKNALIFSDKITPISLKNNTDKFPYLTEKYIVGGYFMWYLSNKYGYNKVNQFFYYHSQHYINPFLLETSFYNYFGVTMYKAIQNFILYTKNKYKFNPLNTTMISSKSYIYLSKIKNKIYFITTNLINQKLLNIYNTNLISKKTTLKNGKIFDFNKLYTLSNQQISAKKIKWGLFDKNNNYLPNSIGKYYLTKHSYIDINSSMIYPKFYYKNHLFDENISSALEYNNSIYYFKQINNIKVCYKNKIPLFSFKGYFAKLVDINKNKIYFIANTKSGSSLFMFDKKIYQLTPYDNIINAKIIKNKYLVETINSDGYHITFIKPNKQLQNPYFPIIKQNNFYFKTSDIKLNPKKYQKTLKFSYLYPSYSYDSQKHNIFTFNMLFSDILMKNFLQSYGYFDDQDSLIALNYINANKILPFSLFYSNDNYKAIKFFKKLIKSNNKSVISTLNFYNETDNHIVFDINYNYFQNFPLQFDNFLNFDIDLIAKNDGYGIKSKFTKHLYDEFYTSINFDYLRNNQIVTNNFDKLKDVSNLYIESFTNNFYVDKSIKSSIKFSKTLHLSKYFYYFPISINKENIFVGYNHYLLDTTNVNEKMIGIKLDTIFFYKFNIPIICKYIYNDFNKNHIFKLTFGTEF